MHELHKINTFEPIHICDSWGFYIDIEKYNYEHVKDEHVNLKKNIIEKDYTARVMSNTFIVIAISYLTFVFRLFV
jgi:hypothetical protein